jgi:mRNA-decapping enzyme subunit 2
MSTVQPPNTQDSSHYSQDFVDALDEVHTRFLMNLPPEELSTSDRIFFQLEQAWWFYEDMICDQREADGDLPRFSQMKTFARHLFYFSPLLRDMDFNKMWKEFTDYKTKISTYGCILLNSAATHVLLCQVYKGDTWTFPAGKINQGESGVEAAARETYEETGFDPQCEIGTTKDWQELEPQKVTWDPRLNEERDMVTFVENNGKRRTCYICHGVPDDGSFDFAPVARKEVGLIRWFDLSDLPKKSFAVFPFIAGVRKWIKQNVRNKSRGKRDKSSGRDKSAGRDKSKGRSGSNRRHNNRQKSPDHAASTARLIDSGLLSSENDAIGWSVADMFKANELLIGRKVDYDGNPHVFAEQGFQGNDPHAFRVIGGSFMNSSVNDGSLAATPSQHSKYQPLVNTGRVDEDADVLQPFFSTQGSTPWGEVIDEAKSSSSLPTAMDSVEDGVGIKVNRESTSLLICEGKEDLESVVDNCPRLQRGNGDVDIMTDNQITTMRKSEYERECRLLAQYEADTEFVRQWVQNLPNPTGFKIQNVDAIIAKHFGPGF